jgi:ferredoxin
MNPHLKIDKQKCIGCGLCPSMDSETFEMDYEKGKAKIKKQPLKITEKISRAIRHCPVSAIEIKKNE